MIGFLNGTIIAKTDVSVLVDVHGVGYSVFVPTTIVAGVTNGDSLQLFTHTHVREDVLELYGFSSQEDLVLFTFLIGVSGVGCRTALGIFSVGSRQAIVQALRGGDVSFFTAVPRLGKKNAQKIIIELKNKIGAANDLDLSDTTIAEDDDVFAALKSFGYSQQEAARALQTIPKDVSVQEKIKRALKYLGK